MLLRQLHGTACRPLSADPPCLSQFFAAVALLGCLALARAQTDADILVSSPPLVVQGLQQVHVPPQLCLTFLAPALQRTRPRPPSVRSHPQYVADPARLPPQNFALQLEYLEGEFYACASTGSGLPSELRGGGPASTGCQKAELGTAIQDLAVELAANEKTHVRPSPRACHTSALPAVSLLLAAVDAAAWPWLVRTSGLLPG